MSPTAASPSAAKIVQHLLSPTLASSTHFNSCTADKASQVWRKCQKPQSP